MKTSLKFTTAALVIAALGAGSGPAFAQDAGASNDDGSVADIVVTATRRDESIQDVPMTLQAFGTDTLAAFYQRVLSGSESAPERGEHRLF